MLSSTRPPRRLTLRPSAAVRRAMPRPRRSRGMRDRWTRARPTSRAPARPLPGSSATRGTTPSPPPRPWGGQANSNPPPGSLRPAMQVSTRRPRRLTRWAPTPLTVHPSRRATTRPTATPTRHPAVAPHPSEPCPRRQPTRRRRARRTATRRHLRRVVTRPHLRLGAMRRLPRRTGTPRAGTSRRRLRSSARTTICRRTR